MTDAQDPWTILRVLNSSRELFEKRGVDSPRLDAEVLMASALSVERGMLYARYDQPLLPAELEKIRSLVKRRANGEPVAYILGEREFYSLPLHVSNKVLIPRPDTETLVEVALERIATIKDPRIVDVGTGSGAIALALKKERPDAVVTASDVSREALAVARQNAARLGLELRCLESDLLASIDGPYELVVANLPYIPSAQLPSLMREVKNHEPAVALDGGPDGFALIRRLSADLPRVMAPGGIVALEAGHDQLEAVAALLGEASLVEIRVKKDYGGQPRVASALWRGQP